ncbi:MAG: hypothetical protein H0X64_05115 [Gemmatimonadaceae bacterium]|nr:hypothetical protein [Gemmatimonadaceae bacterium]
MSDLQLRARSTTEIVDAAVQLYRREPMKYMLLTALAYAPFVVLQLMVVGGASRVLGPAVGPTLVLTYVLTFVAFAIMSAVIARMAAAAYLGEAREIEETVREVLPAVPSVIWSTILKYFMVMIGLLLFIVGGLYVVARYFATTQAIVLEGTGAHAAFRRSSELSKGLKRHVFNTLALVWVLYFIASVAVSMLAGLGGEILITIVSTLVAVVVYPIVGIAEVVLYYDARVRQEGYDIEVMTASLEPAPAAGA